MLVDNPNKYFILLVEIISVEDRTVIQLNSDSSVTFDSGKLLSPPLKPGTSDIEPICIDEYELFIRSLSIDSQISYRLTNQSLVKTKPLFVHEKKLQPLSGIVIGQTSENLSQKSQSYSNSLTISLLDSDSSLSIKPISNIETNHRNNYISHRKIHRDSFEAVTFVYKKTDIYGFELSKEYVHFIEVPKDLDVKIESQYKQLYSGKIVEAKSFI